MKYTICSVGDAIHTSPMPKGYDGMDVKEILGQADVRLFNLEYVVSDRAPAFGSSFCGGTWLVAGTDTLDDILGFGFNGCSFANNHTMDYSYDGLFSTLEAVRERGLPTSGAGRDLKEASAPAVIDTPKGKCALISVCSTFNDAARAGNASSTVAGRPGINPLRFSAVYDVTPAHMQALKEIAAGTMIDGRRNLSRAGGYTPAPPAGMMGFGEYTFRESETEGKTTVPCAADVERTVADIKAARLTCKHVAVNIHSHEIKGMTDDEPDGFMVDFARKCVDAGASAVIGTGTHQLKHIEFYKGKPIFYSVGNFMFQPDTGLARMPADFGEKYGYPADATPREWIDMRSDHGRRGLHTDAVNFRSLMPFITYEDDEVTETKCYLLRLNMETGMPALASAEEQRIIFDYMVDRCKRSNALLTLCDGYILVKERKD